MGLAIVLVVLLIGGSGGSGPPFDPRSVEPDGARGVVEVLEDLGAEVDISRSVPQATDASALLLVDRLLQDDRAAVTSWVERGGVLVVADPTSPFVPFTRQGFAGPLEAGNCPIAALTDANDLHMERGAFFAPEGADWCFGSADLAHIVAIPTGEGVIVAVGGQQLFTNAQLDEADAAVVAANLLLPADTSSGPVGVAFLGPSVVPLDDAGASVAPRVINALIMAMVAFLFYAFHRARRLGRVVPEPLPVRIHSSELVLQAGRLSERAADPAGAAEVIRDDFIRRAAQSLAMPPGEDLAMVADVLHQTTNHPIAEITTALTSPVTSDAELVTISRTIAALDRALFDPPPADSPAPDPSSTDSPSTDSSSLDSDAHLLETS